MRRRYKILAIIIIAAIIVGVGYFYNPFVEEKCFSQQLYEIGDGNAVAANQNAVLISSCMLTNGNTPDIVFASILDKIEVIFYYDEPTDDWSSYIYGEPHNSLAVIEADKVYYLAMLEDALLVIE